MSDEHITAEMNDHHPYALQPFSKRIRLDRADAWWVMSLKERSFLCCLLVWHLGPSVRVRPQQRDGHKPEAWFLTPCSHHQPWRGSQGCGLGSVTVTSPGSYLICPRHWCCHHTAPWKQEERWGWGPKSSAKALPRPRERDHTLSRQQVPQGEWRAWEGRDRLSTLFISQGYLNRRHRAKDNLWVKYDHNKLWVNF